MSARTGIQWCDSTWNPIRGCSRVSTGCEHCYAEAVAARFSGPGQAYEGLARRRSNGEPQWTGDVRVIETHMLDPIRWREPRRIFVNSMSDLFHEKISDETIDRVFAVMALAARHTFQILTKRPERMRDYLSDEGYRLKRVHRAIAGIQDQLLWKRYRDDTADRWPMRHVWLGVSVENQATADERIPWLLRTSAAVRFVSCEPLLGALDLRNIDAQRAGHKSMWFVDALTGDHDDMGRWCSPVATLDWIIIGGESGQHARACDLQWIRDLVAQCRAAGIAPFVKQGGRSNRCAHDEKGGCLSCLPDDLRIRDFPNA